MISYLRSSKNMTKNKLWFTLVFSWWSNNFWWHQEGRFFCWLGYVLTTTSTGIWARAFIVFILLFLLWCTTCRPRRYGSCFAPNNAWPSPHLSQTPWPSWSVQKYIYMFFFCTYQKRNLYILWAYLNWVCIQRGQRKMRFKMQREFQICWWMLWTVECRNPLSTRSELSVKFEH